MDVKRFERHGPAWEEVELGEVFSQQVRIFCVDIVAPFNAAALFFDDANGVVVLHTGEWQFRDDHLDQFLTLFCSEGVDGGDEVLRFLIFGNGFPDVVKHAFKHAHHVVVVGPRALDIKGDEFGQVAVGVAFLRSEGGPDFEDALQTSAHAKLLEELRGLVQEGRAVEVLHGKQIRSTFGGGGDDLWRVRFDKTFGDEVFSAVLQDFSSEAEHGVDVGSSEVEEPVVEAGVKFDIHVVGNAQR